jgi:hypothetical protein
MDGGVVMSSSQLTLDDVVIAQSWLRNPDLANSEALAILDRSLQHLRVLLGKDLTRKDLVTYLRMQMGILSKSEKLPKESPSNQFPGAAIFRR